MAGVFLFLLLGATAFALDPGKSIYQYNCQTWSRQHGLSAKEMGGSLTVHSDGAGRGANFTLELPLHSLTDNQQP